MELFELLQSAAKTLRIEKKVYVSFSVIKSEDSCIVKSACTNINYGCKDSRMEKSCNDNYSLENFISSGKPINFKDEKSDKLDDIYQENNRVKML